MARAYTSRNESSIGDYDFSLAVASPLAAARACSLRGNAPRIRSRSQLCGSIANQKPGFQFVVTTDRGSPFLDSPEMAKPLESGQDIRTVQELLGHADVSTTMICTHVLNRPGLDVRSPSDC